MQNGHDLYPSEYNFKYFTRLQSFLKKYCMNVLWSQKCFLGRIAYILNREAELISFKQSLKNALHLELLIQGQIQFVELCPFGQIHEHFLLRH